MAIETPLPKRLLSQQIAEVRREIAIRVRAYPGFVARASLTQDEADEHLATMQAVLATLLFVQRYSARIRSALEFRDTP